MNPFLFVLGILTLIFSVPLMAILTEHRRKVLEIKLRAGSAASANVSSRLQELTREIADLRATTTEYDLSFDAALERMEARIAHLEDRVRQLEARSTASPIGDFQEVRNTGA